MTTNGYHPSREQMAGIVTAARSLYRIIRDWRKDSCLPGYPVDMGNVAAMEAVFGLEFALNPHRLGWDDVRRTRLMVRCWPADVGVGLAWLRNLTDLVLERHQLQSLTRIARWVPTPDTTPALISIADDEFQAIGRAIRKMPRLPVPSGGRAAHLAGQAPVFHLDSSGDATDGSGSPVFLIKATSRPFVLGKPKEVLTPSQFQVVKALVQAGPDGLKLAALKNVCGDAVNVLKRLARSDDDWRAVIVLPGRSRSGYRLDFSAGEPRSTPSHSTSPQQSTQPEAVDGAIIEWSDDATTAGRPAASIA